MSQSLHFHPSSKVDLGAECQADAQVPVEVLPAQG